MVISRPNTSGWYFHTFNAIGHNSMDITCTIEVSCALLQNTGRKLWWMKEMCRWWNIICWGVCGFTCHFKLLFVLCVQTWRMSRLRIIISSEQYQFWSMCTAFCRTKLFESIMLCTRMLLTFSLSFALLWILAVAYPLLFRLSLLLFSFFP